MRKILAVAACLGVLSVLIPAQAGAHQAAKYCGHQQQMGAGWYNLYGHGVPCWKAKKVAKRWQNKCVWGPGCGEDGSTRINVRPGFRCKIVQKVGTESVKVRCTAGQERVVHFHWGA